MSALHREAWSQLTFARTDTSSRTGRRTANRGKQRWSAAQASTLTTYSVTELLPRRAQRDFLAMLLGTTSRRVQVIFFFFLFRR